MIDTHAHLYLPEFDEDREKMIAAAQNAGVCRCWIPAIHYDSLQAMEALREKHKDYFDFFAGLHPTEVRENYRQELDLIYKALSENEYKGIGEIGLDLYWDKSFYKEQVDALQVQLHWAVEKDMPVLLHIRNAFDEIMPIIRPYCAKGLRGIFHSFSGNLQQARELTEQGGFLLGIGGSIT